MNCVVSISSNVVGIDFFYQTLVTRGGSVVDNSGADAVFKYLDIEHLAVSKAASPAVNSEGCGTFSISWFG